MALPTLLVTNEGDGIGIAVQAEGEARMVLLVPSKPLHTFDGRDSIL